MVELSRNCIEVLLLTKELETESEIGATFVGPCWRYPEFHDQ